MNIHERLERSEKAQKAIGYFMDGYNCAQAVFLAFASECGIEQQLAARMSSSFGGGMGRLREVCGAVSAMFLGAGCLYGYEDPKAKEEKKEHYQRIQELADAFRQEKGSIICRELLNLKVQREDPTPSERTPEYYQKRPCAVQVGLAAAILEEYIAKHPLEKSSTSV